jgi:hypothetical protein
LVFKIGSSIFCDDSVVNKGRNRHFLFGCSRLCTIYRATIYVKSLRTHFSNLILEPLPHKCGVPFVAERRIYAAATLQNLKMRIAERA